MTVPAILNQDRLMFTDATVFSCTPTGSGTSMNLIGQVKTVKASIKREFKKVTAAYDKFQSKRATRWDEGTLDITGFDQLAGSLFAALFVAGATATLMFQCATSGDVWQFQVTQEGYDINVSDNPTESSVKYAIVGVPYYGAAGSAVAPIVVGT